MRSIPFTLALFLLASAIWGLAAWRINEGNLDGIFGTPATPVGERLYASFEPDQVARIRVTATGLDAEFQKIEQTWQGVEPWQDRMDPRHAFGIIGFTLGLRIEDAAPTDEVDREKTGLSDGPLQIHLLDAKGETLARYRVGRRTPWRGTSEDTGEAISTVYVQPRDSKRKGHIYICTGDILDLFKEGGKFLRDHQPFYFNPIALEKIRIRGPEGELTLGREAPGDPWRITKPLELRTDTAAVRSLLTGLLGLQAVRLSDRSAVTLPSNSGATATRQITLASFGSSEDIVLEIYPPATPDARDVLATVSDRPGTIFELPIKPEPGLVSIADLPLAVNELRDPTLAHLNLSALREIRIRSATGGDILLVRQPPRWLVAIDGKIREANEQRLVELLEAVTTGRALGFETDAASDLSPWGLDRPILNLEFKGEGDQTIQLNFGLDLRGNLFAHRPGTTSVMRVDSAMLSSFAIQLHEWRHERVWNINRVYLKGLERSFNGGEPMELRYDFYDYSWQARQTTAAPARQVDPNRANYLLGALEQLRTQRWLAPGNPDAAVALALPAIVIVLTENVENDEGTFQGVQRQELRIAPVPGTSPPSLYFGQISGEAQPFLLDRQTVEKLAMNLSGSNE